MIVNNKLTTTFWGWTPVYIRILLPEMNQITLKNNKELEKNEELYLADGLQRQATFTK